MHDLRPVLCSYSHTRSGHSEETPGPHCVLFHACTAVDSSFAKRTPPYRTRVDHLRFLHRSPVLCETSRKSLVVILSFIPRLLCILVLFTSLIHVYGSCVEHPLATVAISQPVPAAPASTTLVQWKSGYTTFKTRRLPRTDTILVSASAVRL